MQEKRSFFQKFASIVSANTPFKVISKRDSDALDSSQARMKAVALNTLAQGARSMGSIKSNWLKKPGRVSFRMLRQIARQDALTRICVNVIKKSVSQCSWEIRAKKKAPGNHEIYKNEIEEAYELLEFMNNNGENMRILLDRVLEDLLILDAGAIEKVWSLDWTKLMALNSVDGATIRPVYNEFGELGNPAYFQYVNNKKAAEFSKEELVYMMANPQNDLNNFWYWLSPIESILLQVQASLEADLYNIKSFTKDNVPPGMLDLGDLTNEQAEEFIATWNATVITNQQSLKFIWGSDNTKKYIPFNSSNKDMQYSEYIDWLSRVKLAAYGLSSIDANIFQDANYSNSKVQEQLSKSRWVRNAKHLVEEYFTRQVLRQMGENFKRLEFKFVEAETLEEKKTQADIDKIYVDTGIMEVNEVRERDGLEPKEEMDYDEDLDAGIAQAMGDEVIELDPTAEWVNKSMKSFY